MKKYFSIFLFAIIIFFLSCEKDTNTLPPKSVALLGSINNINGVEIYLSKALDPNGVYAVTSLDVIFTISNATVNLIDENNQSYDLKFVANGKYAIDTTFFKPEINKKYKIMADVPNYGKIESEWVIFPEPVKIVNFSSKIDTFISAEDPKFLSAAIDITLKTNNQTQFYQFNYDARSNDNIRLTYLFPLTLENIKLNEKEAAECGRIYKSSSILFTSDCLKNNQYHEFLRLDGNTIKNHVIVEKLKLKGATISESYHKFNANIMAQQEIDTRFQEVPPSYTNIKNGIGCFYARNESKEVFVVKP